MIMAYTEKNKDERKADIVAAFYSAYFYRKKELSGNDLKKALKAIDGNSNRMTDEDLFEAIKVLHAQFGGE
ncbi:MAG: hypothetical protein WA125_17060 [Desulfosporosinus sp.]